MALRALPAERVNGDMNMATLLLRPSTYAGGPIFDGEIVTANPEVVLRQGKAANVPLLIGTTSADLGITHFLPQDDPLSFFGANAERASALYNPSGALQPAQILATLGMDLAMQEPARFVAQQMTAAGNPVWLYRFGYVAESLRPETMGAEHASEQPYLFSTLDARYGAAVTDNDQAMARLFHTYFANFANSGNPNGSGLPPWTPYNSTQLDLMMFTLDTSAVMQADPWQERLDLVEEAVDAQTSLLDAAPERQSTEQNRCIRLLTFHGPC